MKVRGQYAAVFHSIHTLESNRSVDYCTFSRAGEARPSSHETLGVTCIVVNVRTAKFSIKISLKRCRMNARADITGYYRNCPLDYGNFQFCRALNRPHSQWLELPPPAEKSARRHAVVGTSFYWSGCIDAKRNWSTRKMGALVARANFQETFQRFVITLRIFYANLQYFDRRYDRNGFTFENYKNSKYCKILDISLQSSTQIRRNLQSLFLLKLELLNQLLRISIFV